jgi:glycosyltransferase involved in cell wall biosynthesis
MKVALVHDWLTGMRGGEKVFEGITTLFPKGEIFTLVHVRGSVSSILEARPIHTSFLQRVPGVARHYRKLLPLYPRAIESFDLSSFDLVVSSSHCAAKGVRVPPGVPHVCYCHTPMRYLWDHYSTYFGPGRARWFVRGTMACVARRLRRWDVATSRRVDVFVANSSNVAARIRRIYDRDALVLRPWVDHAFYTPGGEVSDYFLLVSALVPYKRNEVAIEAFRGLTHRLLVAGSGPDRERLEQGAPSNVVFLGHVPDERLRDLYRGARALLFPTDEDFGIVPLESMACGRPVIALRRGGALETVVDGVTGTFVEEQTPEALRAVVRAFSAERFDPKTVRAHAVRFDRTHFLAEFQRIVDTVGSGSAAAGRAEAGARG